MTKTNIGIDNLRSHSVRAAVEDNTHLPGGAGPEQMHGGRLSRHAGRKVGGPN
jgi:hypothetical protein